MAAEVEAMGWNSVQELAGSGQELPSHYILREEDRPVEAAPPQASIPVIDLSILFEPNRRGDDENAKLKSALQTWGMFLAVGHGMPESLLDEVHNVAKEFFQLPMELKQKYRNLKHGKAFTQGYGSDHATTTDSILNWTDRLILLIQPEDKRMPNLWPEEPSSFRDVVHEFILKAKKVKELVLKATANLLELNEDYFINQTGDEARADCRFNYYPYCSRPDLVFGLVPHSDASLITMLLPDKDVEGLQILKDDQWLKVPTVAHALLFVLGDEMEITSNGIFKSPVHRVLTNLEKERLSVALFYHLELENNLGAADELVDESRPRLYKTMKAGDYLEFSFQCYKTGKRALNSMKI